MPEVYAQDRATGRLRKLGPKDTLRDGEVLRATVTAMDRQTVPNHAQQITDEQRIADARAEADAAREAMIKGLNDSWKQPTPTSDEAGKASRQPSTTEHTSAESAHDAYVKSITDGWKEQA